MGHERDSNGFMSFPHNFMIAPLHTLPSLILPLLPPVVKPHLPRSHRNTRQSGEDC